MNVIALILWIVAAVLFLVGGAYEPAVAAGRRGWYNHLGLGLALFVVGAIVQLAAKSHTVTF